MPEIGIETMKILNLGCGAKVSSQCVNIDWSIYIRIAKNPVWFYFARRILTPQRVAKLERIRANPMVAHDLTRGIPYSGDSVDAVYNSHFLEHMDRNLLDPARDTALNFVKECRRVLKPGGVLRIVVPDLERRARAYLQHLEVASTHPEEFAMHDNFVRDILEQSVRKMAFGASTQRPLQRRIEVLLLGDARKHGETHQWEYDRINLRALLESAGFTFTRIVDYRTSAIPKWEEINLDLDEHGAEYKPHSLYAEAIK
jgi:predicted SAM-dependent methyltransferase